MKAISLFLIALVSLTIFETTNATAQPTRIRNHKAVKLNKTIKVRPDLNLNLTSKQPDLVISSLVKVGGVKKTAKNFEITVLAKVTNKGNGNAGAFKVSASYKKPGSSSYGLVAFSSNKSVWYPYVKSLAAGKTTTIYGKFVIPRSFVKKSGKYAFKVYADSCSGDEFAKDYCRVKESNENNNSSTPIIVQINK